MKDLDQELDDHDHRRFGERRSFLLKIWRPGQTSVRWYAHWILRGASPRNYLPQRDRFLLSFLTMTDFSVFHCIGEPVS
jgi:hypothetical protein